MPRLRSGRGEEPPSKAQRLAVVALAVANLVACAATLSYLHTVGHAELPGYEGYTPPKLRLSWLPAPATPPRVVTTVPTADGPGVKKKAQETSRLLPPSRLQIGPSCWRCSGAVRGPLPTTLLREPSEADCTWELHSNSFLQDFPNELDGKYRLSVAKQLCAELEDLCTGVTCESPTPAAAEEGQRCSVRAGSDLQPSDREISLVKKCPLPPVTAAGDCLEGDPAKVSPGIPTSAGELRRAAVVVLAHNRKRELKSCLDSLLSLKDVGLFRLHVSIDDLVAFEAMEAAVKEVAEPKGVEIGVWKVNPKVVDPKLHNKEMQAWFKYNAAKIAHHYQVAMERTFMEYGYEYAIFVEEDLLFSPDFLALFRSTVWLLEADPSLWCVSAWSDFGFSMTAVDTCRLQRTSYFPGLGFMLSRTAWLSLRKAWPMAPTMGWDYWMRVAFRREGKECVVPEVSRSHHASAHGSSVTEEKQLKLFRLMAFAQIPNTCKPTGPCHQFGDITYLLEDAYEGWMRNAIRDALPAGDEGLASLANVRAAPGHYWVVPFVREQFLNMVEAAGLYPRNLHYAIPADVRSEHYGVVAGRHKDSRAPLLLVDRRNPKGYLPDDIQLKRSEFMTSVAADRGQNCNDACGAKGLVCDAEQLHFVNDCKSLQEHFGCEAGCAHQVGGELPVYVPHDFQPTYRQCLVTFISTLTCEAAHESTARICACMPPSG